MNAHYLLAVAAMRSGIKDDTEGDRVGPFRITQPIWNASSFAPDLEVVLEATDIGRWRLQCTFAALNTLRAQNRLLERLGRYPSAVELYREQWPNDPVELPDALQRALDATLELYEDAVNEVTGAATVVPPPIADAETPAPPTVVEPTAPAPSEPAPPVVGEPSSPITDEPAAPAPRPGDEVFVKKAPWIMEKLINDFDLTEVQAAGILGNIGHECAGFHLMQEVRPRAGRGGFGWCQWTASRRTNFEEFCESQGLGTTSDAANYAFLKRELETSERRALAAVKAREVDTISEAVRVFEQKFERAAADAKHYDRRERWAKLALDSFRQRQDRLPTTIAQMLDADLRYQVLASAKSGSTEFWLIEQFTENGGQFLIEHVPGQEPKILASDTSIFPLQAGLVPAAVAAELASAFDPSPADQPTGPTPAPAPDADIASRILAQAKACNETLVTRGVPNTNRGRLACAWAVNEVARRALGNPVGGGLSTIKMSEVLRRKHRLLPESELTAGTIVISPTQGRNVGHVGIVGSLTTPLSETVIYSNSSSRAVFSDHFTIKKWKAFYGTRKGLPVSFYALRNPL